MKFKLKTNDALKCAACGNKEFEEKRMTMGSENCWCYICTDCGHMMSFMVQNEEKKSML